MKTSGKTSSVLVVDDHQMMLNLVGSILETSGFKVFYAKDSNEAIKILNTCEIDLVLLDIMMPGVDGFQLCKKIKDTDHWKDIPIIFLSSLSDSSDVVKAFRQGGVDFIAKPFNKDEFLARINIHLGIKRMSDHYMMQLDDLRRTNRYLLGTMHEMAKVMEDARIN
jgi:two-component system sensor histidine kinase/response regulator